jgi:hypothetical protein
VRVGFERFLVVEVCLDKYITGAFGIHHLDILGVPYDKSYLDFIRRFLLDVVDLWLLVFRDVGVVDFNPHLEHTLRDI